MNFVRLQRNSTGHALPTIVSHPHWHRILCRKSRGNEFLEIHIQGEQGARTFNFRRNGSLPSSDVGALHHQGASAVRRRFVSRLGRPTRVCRCRVATAHTEVVVMTETVRDDIGRSGDTGCSRCCGAVDDHCRQHHTGQCCGAGSRGPPDRREHGPHPDWQEHHLGRHRCREGCGRRSVAGLGRVRCFDCHRRSAGQHPRGRVRQHHLGGCGRCRLGVVGQRKP